MISASRTAVWAAVAVEFEGPRGHYQEIVGAPASGVGAKHVSLGPPVPPFGLRPVMYTEVTAELEGFWQTTQTFAGAWELTETLLLEDAGDDQTLARVTGWWVKPAPSQQDFTKMQVALNGFAAEFLDRLAGFAAPDPPQAPPQAH